MPSSPSRVAVFLDVSFLGGGAPSWFSGPLVALVLLALGVRRLLVDSLSGRWATGDLRGVGVSGARHVVFDVDDKVEGRVVTFLGRARVGGPGASGRRGLCADVLLLDDDVAAVLVREHARENLPRDVHRAHAHDDGDSDDDDDVAAGGGGGLRGIIFIELRGRLIFDWAWLRDGGRVESGGRLGEDAAVERGAGFEHGVGLDKESALEVRGRSGIEVSGHLPDNVGGLGNAAAGAVVHEHDLRTAARDDITGGQEDEEVGGGALEVNVGAEVDVGAPLIHARREVCPVDEAILDVEVCAIRDGAPSRVGISRLHVADGGRHHRWRGRDVV
mmetsp:Transcript_59977/g.157739  ORF Transcript_59977/g.157739 Transcript_59977/m.157739 type:complete len:331 (+) Transcript_59977:359-1351(+)